MYKRISRSELAYRIAMLKSKGYVITQEGNSDRGLYIATKDNKTINIKYTRNGWISIN